MRRRTLLAVLTSTGLAMAACSDRNPTSPPATDDVQLQPAQVDALLAQNPSILELRMQSDELLREPARTLARFALAKVQFDINYQRPTLYASSLIFAAIPLVERKLNRIPEEKVGKLIDLLCTLQQLIGPKLPPTSRLNMIPWCQLNPEELGNEAEFQLVSNSTGGTVETNTEQLSLTIAANTMQDAAGNPVSNAFFTVLPIERRPPGSEASHPCPQPFTEEGLSGRDCYPEFYEISSRPLVQFVGTRALLQVCQLDAGSESIDAPTSGVLARLQLFARSASGTATLLPKATREGEASLPINDAACDGDEDLGHTAIGPIDLSRDGLRNAWLAVGRSGSRALKALGPKTLYASNVPTHGRVEREIIDFAGTVVGALDPVGEVTNVSVDPNSGSIPVGGTMELSAIARDDAGNIVDAPITWSSNNNPVATVSASGLVTGVAPGEAIITATSGSGSSFATITVTPAGCGSDCPAQVLYGVNSNNDGLSFINPATGVSTFIGRHSPDVETFTTPVAMAVDPATDVLYVWNNSSPSSVLLTVNRCTGLATQVNTEPQSTLDGGLGALAISPLSGTMYNMRSNLYTISKTTGIATLVGSLGGPEIFGADFDPTTGLLYGLDAGGSNLYIINTETGEATLLATLSQAVGTVGSIAFTNTGNLVGSAFVPQDILFDINKSTGVVSNVRTVTGTGGVPQGMGFSGSCEQIP